MRKLVASFAMALGLVAGSASADQATLKAMQDAGVKLTQEQADSLASIRCTHEEVKLDKKPNKGCQALIDKVADLVAAYEADDAKVEAILRAASKAHPQYATEFGEAAMGTAPTQIALISQIMLETAPTAAGPGNAPGLNVARSVANPRNNIPTPNGGGGSSSPN